VNEVALPGWPKAASFRRNLPPSNALTSPHLVRDCPLCQKRSFAGPISWIRVLRRWAATVSMKSPAQGGAHRLFDAKATPNPVFMPADKSALVETSWKASNETA
jgi:hypothetical protein